MTAISSAVRSLGGDFPAEAFGRTYRLWPRVGDFSDLFTWDDLNQLIARHRLEPPRLRLFGDGSQIPQHRYAHPVVSKRHTVWHRIEPAGLHHQLKDGASLVLDAVDALHSGVEDLATALERHFRTDVQVNLYASWTPKEGFGVHWDDHDVVVVQLEGAKRWKLTDALHEGVIEEFINARGSTDPGRPMPSLPFVDGIPADGSLCVRLTAAGAWYGVDEDGHVVFNAGGQEWTFSRPVLAVIKSLLEGNTTTLGDLSVGSGLPVGHVAALVSELVEAGVAAVSRRR
ncbi:cupin domain-containing protein [Streptomyces decoyicus]|uniref:JmjC domain-containing protein n=1 Tax=Streptomyces decoyicus TaxID=249567 RepID=UPI0033EBD6DB